MNALINRIYEDTTDENEETSQQEPHNAKMRSILLSVRYKQFQLSLNLTRIAGLCSLYIWVTMLWFTYAIHAIPTGLTLRLFYFHSHFNK